VPTAAHSSTPVVVGILTALLLAGTAGWIISRRRRVARRTIVSPDPWGPHGVLSVFGAVAGDPADAGGHRTGVADAPRGLPHSVPELLLIPVESKADTTVSDLDLPPPPSSLRPNRHPVR